MIDYEGSRAEFLKILAEMGEEPAFIRREREAQAALNRLLLRCSKKREEMLKWPQFHFSALFHRVCGDWSCLGSYVVDDHPDSRFCQLAKQLTITESAKAAFFATNRSLLKQFLESGLRFNEAWTCFLDEAGLDTVNSLRDDYNKFYPLEKACAIGIEVDSFGFTPMPMLDRTYLDDRFPLLSLPILKGSFPIRG